MKFLFLAILLFASPLRAASLIQFTADWCPHCQAIRPVVKTYLALGYKIDMVHVDHDRAKTRKYGVTSIPSFVVVDDDGAFMERAVCLNAKQLDALIRKHQITPVKIQKPNPFRTITLPVTR